MIISGSIILLNCEMFWTKVVEKTKTHISVFCNFFLNCAIYEIMWKNIVEPDSPRDKTAACALHAG